MKQLIKTAFLAAGVALVSQAAQAAYNANDLVLGFNLGLGSGPNDYIIDLGSASSVGVGGSSVVTLSGFSLSTFNSTYAGGLSSGVSMSVLGGNPISGANRDLFATSLRVGLGTVNVANSGAPSSVDSSSMGGGANDVKSLVNNLPLSPGGSITVSQSNPNSFYNWILNITPPSFASDTGVDPSATGAGPVLYEDLYRSQDGVNGNNFSYVGFFMLDTTGQGSLTFTPVAVPEPSTGLAISAGLLALAFRRQLKNRTQLN